MLVTRVGCVAVRFFCRTVPGTCGLISVVSVVSGTPHLICLVSGTCGFASVASCTCDVVCLVSSCLAAVDSSTFHLESVISGTCVRPLWYLASVVCPDRGPSLTLLSVHVITLLLAVLCKEIPHGDAVPTTVALGTGFPGV